MEIHYSNSGGVGPQGPVGPRGDIGPTGPTGSAGPLPWTLVGAYDNGVSYGLGDAVTYQGGFYYRTGNPLNPGYPPTPGSINASWTPVADAGATGPTGPAGTPAELEFASFFSTQTQQGGSIRAMTFNNTDFGALGISMVDNSKITVNALGYFNIAFSAQLVKTGGTSADVYIWLSHNGVAVPDSATVVTIGNNSPKLVAAWNFFVRADTLPQYYQLMWYTADTQTSIAYINDAASPAGVPAVPSVILTINQVGAD